MNNISDIIKAKIKNKGPITFADFMELALYEPTYGYYCSGNVKIGKEGDFYTSPYVNKAFGSAIGNFISKSFELIEDEDLALIELGAGKGVLALDILNHLKINNIEQYNQMTYHLIEQSDHSRNEIKETLIKHNDKLKLSSNLDDLKSNSISGVVISNELFDAIPFHRLKFRNESLSEIYVTLENGNFIETFDYPSKDELLKYFEDNNMELVEGQEIEINLKAKKILENINRVFKKGFIVNIDYGYLEDELFNPNRMKGTYKCIYKHSINETPYLNVGEQDITAHVDFSNLIRIGESLKINGFKYTTQGQFLIDWGILDIIEKNFENNAEIQAIKNLFLPELMGDKFKVLIQEKNLSQKLHNFYPESPFKISFKIL